MNFDRLVEISRALKDEKQTGKQFHVTFAMRRNRIVKIGLNDYHKTHPCTINYVSRFGNNQSYIASLHSESATYEWLRKNDFDPTDLTFVNIRIAPSNNISLAAPCPNCFKYFLAKYGFRRFYYSN